MRSPWKAFFGETALLFVLGLACTFVARIWMDDKNSQLSSAETMHISMRVGVVIASLLIGLIGSLLFWRLKPLLGAVGVGAVLFSSSKPEIALLALLAAVATYQTTSKLRMIFGFYLPNKRADTDE
jgi:ABC-type proline/glycine betaine transport system permease subunit